MVTGGNTKLCCRGFSLTLFQSTKANMIDSEHTHDYRGLYRGFRDMVKAPNIAHLSHLTSVGYNKKETKLKKCAQPNNVIIIC